jgi:hypothetical protein
MHIYLPADLWGTRYGMSISNRAQRRIAWSPLKKKQ